MSIRPYTPVMPHSFYGSLMINGNPSAIGTKVIAVDSDGNDITYELYITTEEGWYGGHSAVQKRLVVNEPVTGTTIHFLVELVPNSGVFAYADQTYEFKSGDLTELSLTATGELPEEGKASIVSVESPSEAQSGDIISISTNIRNDGGSDTIFAVLKDKDTSGVVGARTPIVMDSGSQYTFTWDSTMPNKKLSLLLEAGHEE